MKKYTIIIIILVLLLMLVGCTNKKEPQEYNDKLDSISKLISDKDIDSAEKKIDELSKLDIKDSSIKDKIESMRETINNEKKKVQTIKKIGEIKQLISSEKLDEANKEITTLEYNNITDNDLKKMIDECKSLIASKQDELKNKEEEKQKEIQKRKDEVERKKLEESKQAQGISYIKVAEIVVNKRGYGADKKDLKLFSQSNDWIEFLYGDLGITISKKLQDSASSQINEKGYYVSTWSHQMKNDGGTGTIDPGLFVTQSGKLYSQGHLCYE